MHVVARGKGYFVSLLPPAGGACRDPAFPPNTHPMHALRLSFHMIQTATSEEGPVATVKTTLTPAEKADTTTSFLRVSTCFARTVCLYDCDALCVCGIID